MCVCVALFLKKNVKPIIYVVVSKGPRTKVNIGTVMLEPPLSVEIFSYCKTVGHAGSLEGTECLEEWSAWIDRLRANCSGQSDIRTDISLSTLALPCWYNSVTAPCSVLFVICLSLNLSHTVLLTQQASMSQQRMDTSSFSYSANNYIDELIFN